MNNRYLKPILLFLFIVLTYFAQAQRVISGTVTDSATGETMVGVTVKVLEKSGLGTATDSKGRYSLRLPDNKPYTLEVSFVGYQQQKRTVNAKSGRVDFALKASPKYLETVVVTATRTPKLLKDAPIVTRVITEEDIKTLDAPNIQDVLQAELPGIEFSYAMNQQLSLNMQGFGGNSVLFLVDGERLAGETLDNVDYSRLNMDNVSQIEIVKGAASSLYGSNAVGGVVNLVSRENTEPWTLNLNAHYGTFNNQRYGASLGFKAGSFANMANVQYTRCDAIKLKNDGDFGTIYANNSLNIKDRLTYKYKDKLTLTAKAGYFFRERESQFNATDRYRDFSGNLKADYLFDSLRNLNISYTFDQYDKSDYSTLSGLDVRDYSNVQNSVRTLFNRAFAKSTLTLGGDYLHDYLMSYQFSDHGSHLQHTADAFAQYDWNITSRLNLIAALRYDYFSQASAQHLSPKINIMYKWDKVSLRASYADGFRAPTLKEMFMSFNMANVFMIYGNPDLKSETSHNFNLAVEYTHKSYNLTLMGFFNDVSNRITTVWNRDLAGMQYTNMVPVQISGLDFNAGARWDFGLAVRLSYVFTYEHIPQGQPEVSSTRPHSATLNISYGKKWKKYSFKVMITGRAMSAVTCDEYVSLSDLTQTQRITYPGYSVWKLSLTQKVLKGINLSLAVDNLFNYIPEYYYSNSPATTGTTFMAGLSVDVDEFFR